MFYHNTLVKTLSKMPLGTAVGGALGVSCVISALCMAVFSSGGEKIHTLSPEWVAANKTYMLFQKNNPISGISSRAH